MLSDIYYKKEYISLYLKEGESLFDFVFRKDGYVFYNIAIKRPILNIGEREFETVFFDLETAYGYGGVYCNTDNEDFINEAEKEYVKKCLSQNIIAEFSRVHPFNHFCETYSSFYNFHSLDRKTVVVDTSLDKEERWAQYPSKMKTILRKCTKELTFEKTNNIDCFVQLYKKTMDRNNADDFYYFEKEYFENLLKLEGVDLFVVKYGEVVISASFFMFSKEYGHYHVSANDYDFRRFNANYLMLDSVFEVAYQKNVPWMHLGGGRTNGVDDNLLKFKSKFSPLIKNFYIAGKVFNDSKYKEYVSIWKEQNGEGEPYFLKYRLPNN